MICASCGKLIDYIGEVSVDEDGSFLYWCFECVDEKDEDEE